MAGNGGSGAFSEKAGLEREGVVAGLEQNWRVEDVVQRRPHRRGLGAGLRKGPGLEGRRAGGCPEAGPGPEPQCRASSGQGAAGQRRDVVPGPGTATVQRGSLTRPQG